MEELNSKNIKIYMPVEDLRYIIFTDLALPKFNTSTKPNKLVCKIHCNQADIA